MKNRNYGDQELLRLHQVQLEILREIIRVCEENDITYFAMYGTLLGAMRHNGFIPWDDDVDIGMLREDYDRFLEIAPKKLGKDYFLQHYTTEPKAPAYFAKVRKNGTRFVERYDRRLDIHHGVFVDVFPFDKKPKDEDRYEKHSRRVKFWKQLYMAKSLWGIADPNLRGVKRVLFSVVRGALHVVMIPFSKDFLFRKLDAARRACADEETDRLGRRSRLQDTLPVATHAFETIQIKVPARAEAYLKILYGDWTALPPPEKRINHAPDELVL